MEDGKGEFIGLANFQEYFSSAGLVNSISNSLTIAFLTMIISCTLAFTFAYGLTRTCIPFKRAFRAIATIPILAPSLLPAISLIYLFGNQGVIKGLLFGESMFSVATDASKVALVHLVARLKERGFTVLDTQFMTPHLARFGALTISLEDYRKRLDVALAQRCRFAP